MNTRIQSPIYGLLIALALAGGHSVARADSEMHTKKVAFGDLNLARAENIAKLYVRLGAAGQEVCRAYAGSKLSARARHDTCVSDAIAHAVAEIGIPELTAYHEAKLSGRKPIARLAAR